MDLSAYIPNIRRVYSRPWQDGRPANLGKISTCIQVGVRPETTLIAHETMPRAPAEAPAAGAGAAAVRRGRIHDLHAGGLSLVLEEALQLAECPAVQAPAHALAGFDPIADVPQVLHRDAGD